MPLPPGSGLLESVEEAVAAASRVGFPVMVKAVAGGGGIGMQAVHDPAELPEVFAWVKCLAAQYFKNDGVYLERLITRARHIEVQIFGDGERVVAVGDRDCSVQRRNQKVLKKRRRPACPSAAPRPARGGGNSARRWATVRPARWNSIHDVERSEFYFLEVNTWLQVVEHRVTEEVTGLDLVEWMVRVGAGEKLPAAWPVASSGAAIEARIYAEDPARDLALRRQAYRSALSRRCTRGRLGGGGHRSHGQLRPAAQAHRAGRDRAAAVEKLAAAFKATRIAGIQTNLGYLAAIADAADYRAGSVTTKWANDLAYTPQAVEVIEPGTYTTVQDWPGRLG